jgi:DNA-binding phage protein
MTASRSHDETVVELLKADPEFAAVYLAAAVDEADLPGGESTLLAALHQVAAVVDRRLCWQGPRDAA